MSIRVAQYIADRLADWGVSHVFTLTGGGAMFLNDAFGFHDKIRAVYQHHEQACAIAAEGYARIAGIPGVVVVTTGPGGINALNGVFGAWTDSIPMLVISGQVKRETCLAATPVDGLRQLGDQEAEIVRMATPITKYATVLLDPLQVAVELEKAWHLATSGRPGPVWLDIPIDVQSSLIEPDSLAHYQPPQEIAGGPVTGEALATICQEIAARLQTARRPVLMGGTGVRLSPGGMDAFRALAEAASIPIVTAWTHDLIASDHPLYCGRPGTIGTRPGNFTVQNADLLIVVGSRLNIRQISYNWQSFADRAHVVQIDIDEAELRKPTFRATQAVQADAAHFCSGVLDALRKSQCATGLHADWLAWCKERMHQYPVVQPHHRDIERPINAYHFIETLFDQLDADDIVVTGNATACIVPFQVARIKEGQRLFSNSGSASMGYDLPAAIGAWFGALAVRGQQRRVICLAGDGSLMLNMQELQTLATFGVPVKVLVLNNGGYLSIRGSQANFFKRLAGESSNSGIGFPDYTVLARAFGLDAVRIQAHPFAEQLRAVLDAPGPMLAEVMLDPEQGFEPRMSSRQLPDGKIVSPRLEDMHPFLSREELHSNTLQPEDQP